MSSAQAFVTHPLSATSVSAASVSRPAPETSETSETLPRFGRANLRNLANLQNPEPDFPRNERPGQLAGVGVGFLRHMVRKNSKGAEVLKPPSRADCHSACGNRGN